jgi:hypothetical protein
VVPSFSIILFFSIAQAQLHTSHLPAANHYATTGTAAVLRPSTLAAHPCPPPGATVAGPVATSRERRCIDPFFRAARRRSELTSWPQVRSTLPPSTDLPTSASSPLAASSRRRSLQGWSISGFLITNLMVDFSIFSLSSSGALKKENIQYLLN